MVWLRCRAATGRKIAALAVVLGALAAASPASADESLRLGVSGSLGVLGPPENPLVVQADGEATGMWSAGFGIDVRLGVQMSEMIALDLQVFGETLLMLGDMRAAALLEVAPIPYFAVAAGGGVGTMWNANLYFDDPSADFASGVLRLEGRLPERTRPSPIDKSLDLVFGLEGQLGSVFKGSLPAGTIVLGGRGFGGFLWH